MADIPDNYLLKAVDLLMGRISEQIMTLLEERARGEVDEAEFQARIRELLGTISPEVVARHPLLSPPPPEPEPEPTPEQKPGPEPGTSESAPLPEPSAWELDGDDAGAEPEVVETAAPPPAPEPKPTSEPKPISEPEPSVVDMSSVEVVEAEIVEAGPAEEPEPPAPEPPDETVTDEGPSPYALIVDGVSGYDDYLTDEGADGGAGEEADDGTGLPEPEPPAEPAAGFVLESEPEAAPAPESEFLLEDEPKPAPQPAPKPEPRPAPRAAQKPASGAKPGTPAPSTCKPAPESATQPSRPRRPAPRPGGGRVMVAGRWDMDVADVSMENAAAAGRFNEDEHGLSAPPVNERQAKMLKDMAGREFEDKRRLKSPATAALLSALVAGVGDFYVGAYPSGVLFYAVYFIMVVLFVLRWNYHILLALPVVCAVSALVSHVNAGKHNDMVYALRVKPKSEQKRETHFTMH